MNYSKEDIEYYLIHKEYQELTPDELGFISSEVKSKQEFNQLKKLMEGLLQRQEQETDIQPDPAIKSALMNEFRQKSKFNKVWYNAILIQLFPKEKRIYRMPGVQLAGIAASLILVLNIFILNDPFKKDNHVALNNDNSNEKEISEKKLKNSISENNEAEKSSTDLPAEEGIAAVGLKDDATTEIIVEQPEIPIIEEPEIALMEVEEIATGGFSSGTSFDADSTVRSLGTLMEENIIKDEENNEMLDVDYIAEEADEIEETLLLEGYTNPTVTSGNISNYTSIEEMEINTDMKSVEISKGRIRNKNNVIISRSLNDDKELIELFFTAL